MASIIVMPRAVMRRYNSSMSSTRGVRWLMCVVRTPAMSAATAETRGQLVVPAAVDRFTGQRERGDRRGDEPPARSRFRAAVRRDAPGLGDQRGVEQLPRAPGTARRGRADSGEKKRRVAGRQHRGEHPERVAGQLVCIDRPERRGYHRHRRRRVAQVVEADRVHAERGEQVGHVGEFAGAADADRAVAFGGHPVQRAEPFASDRLPRSRGSLRR